MTSQIPVDELATAAAPLPKLSIVVPAFNEEKNLPFLLERLKAVMADIPASWECVIVDDHSTDGTFELLAKVAAEDARVRVIRLARNHGSFPAITCAFHHVTGDAAVVLAADMQDPPELIRSLFDHWRQGSDVVWACRAKREGESAATIVFSKMYYFIMRKVAGIKELSATGADFFLIGRAVISALNESTERNMSLIPMISWMGFSQTKVYYDKQARLHGKSGWTLARKVKLLKDSLTSFTFLPIRVLSAVGVVIALCGLGFAGYVVWGALFGKRVEGYPSLMVAILVLGGMQMMMLGTLGEYVWRTYDEARGRPRFIIQQTLNLPRERPTSR